MILSHVSAVIFYDLLCYVWLWLSFSIIFLSFFENFLQCILLIFTATPQILLDIPTSNPRSYLLLLFLLVTQVQFVLLMYSQVWKVLLELANLTNLFFMPRCYFLILYRYFEVNHILCELMSTLDLSCPESTPSKWSSLISGTYNLSILSSVMVL